MSRCEQKYWSIVPAAGTGQRFGGDVPKQFQLLNAKPVAQHTLTTLLSVSVIQKIVVPCDMSFEGWNQVEAIQSSRVQLIEGGSTRAESVLNGLLSLVDAADPNDWILVHDMARPCVTKEDITLLIDELKDNFVGGLLVSSINETLKIVDTSSHVIRTVAREHYRKAQTPQLFRFQPLMSAMKNGLDSQYQLTDEAAAMEQAGYKIQTVEGRQDNIKITCPEDLLIAQAILVNQGQQ
ncbi:MAG: 2-C-methyl-D-erythritol 4-phosphate cytidylyltransferase [Porticoccaceae bacterium]|nr:2-C-methyl-D-erythritol 4-phosphate cytidylyltransferase [Porticoccaceae bacterium]